MIKRCECCGQSLPEVRLGVRLPPLKARIFDAIRRGQGISAQEIIDDLGLPVTRSTLRVHIAQINEQIASTGQRIAGNRWLGYRIVARADEH